MLEDFSAHLLDIAENSINAGATDVTLEITEDSRAHSFKFVITDNGRGMDEEILARVIDPFYTTRTTRRVGMGISFLKQVAELCGGGLNISSTPGKGTTLEVTFDTQNLDMPPIGDIPATLMVLLMGHPEINWLYVHKKDDKEYVLRSSELLEALEDIELFRTPEVGLWIRDNAKEGIEALDV